MTELRPISLCNVVYKIIANVLTRKLKSVMDKVLSNNQSALVVHEILHSFKQEVEGEEVRMAIKLDMAKAYDRVEWGFLIEVMGNLGFHPRFCEWIRECISTVSYSVMVNGVPSRYFCPELGLRQSDPLSPFLFLFYVEAISAFIRKKEVEGRLCAVRVAPAAISITHLFFTDDSVVFCKANEKEAEEVINVLEEYGKVFGQIINLGKSSIYFGKGCPKKVKKIIVLRMNIQARDGFGKYLGILADFGHFKKTVFESVWRGIESRIDGWAEQFLLPAGKEILIKSVAMSMSNHVMACFKLLVGTRKEME